MIKLLKVVLLLNKNFYKVGVYRVYFIYCAFIYFIVLDPV